MTAERITRKLAADARKLYKHRAMAVAIQTEIWNGVESLATAAGHGAMEILRKKLGISKAYMSDIRHGHRGIGDETVRRIAGLK